MVNNREESFIKDVKWSKNGEFICFIYDDGQIYSGLVDGSHEWFKELEEGISFVEFSPDNKKILISKKKENIFIFSISGEQIGKFNLPEPYNEYDIATIDWWCDYRKYNIRINEQDFKETKNTTIIDKLENLEKLSDKNRYTLLCSKYKIV